MWRDDRARMARRRSRQAADLRAAVVRLERPGDDTEERTTAVRAAYTRLAVALRGHRHLRSSNVLSHATASADSAEGAGPGVLRASRRAKLTQDGVHILRHPEPYRVLETFERRGGSPKERDRRHLRAARYGGQPSRNQ